MAYNFSLFKERIKGTEEWLIKELSQIRTGRATPSVLDGVFVDSYGSKMTISQLAAISGEDARTLRITPWDSGQIKAIEKAISTANLGFSPVVDDRGIRVVFPELTSERRVAILKAAKMKIEEAKTTLRKERDAVWEDIQKKEKAGGMGEDEKFRLKSDMQKIVDEANKKIEDFLKRKEAEING